MKVGILGAGSIAGVVSGTLEQMPEIGCHAVASRNIDKAKAFAKEHGYAKAYGSYEEMLEDPEVELVYVATPHSHHFEHMKLCIEHGKPALCEKAFCENARQAREIMRLSREKKVYVSEAIWPRYMPSRKIINDALSSGIIGKVYTLTANLSYPISHVERILRPELAGGALLDIGVYGINFMLMHFGEDIDRIESSVRFTDTGVDADESITVFYKDGRMAVLTHSIYPRSDRKGIFHGDKGYMVIENINNPSEINIYDTSDKLIEHIDVPHQISGYEYEFRESIDRISGGFTESLSMPLEESVKMLEIMDSVRQQWNKE
ncbi:MAG: Gfo/Idh/MocA family oxidoreductase [Lachnospiraceae bacterium]|nr:Gfo/Idh/MocA family oxidoreductase [Lachnospiraceae bacterium]